MLYAYNVKTTTCIWASKKLNGRYLPLYIFYCYLVFHFMSLYLDPNNLFHGLSVWIRLWINTAGDTCSKIRFATCKQWSSSWHPEVEMSCTLCCTSIFSSNWDFRKGWIFYFSPFLGAIFSILNMIRTLCWDLVTNLNCGYYLLKRL